MKKSTFDIDNPVRREFLRTTLAASVFALAGSTTELLGEVLPDDFKERGAHLTGIYTLQFSQFPALRTVNGSIRLAIPGAPLSLGQIIVTRVSDSTVTALSEMCTHEGGCAVGNFSGNRFTCVCHGSQFDAAGRVLRGPATAPLPSFQTTFRNGNDFVQIDVPGLATSVKADTQFTSSLSQNFPNPASSNTVIEFSLAKDAVVKIGIFSVLGKEVVELTNKEYEAGIHRISADVANMNKGVYFYRMDTNIGFSQTRKLTVV